MVHCHDCLCSKFDFPIMTHGAHEGLTPSRAEWYGKSLERMNEPGLPEVAKDVDVEVFRLMILHTWETQLS